MKGLFTPPYSQLTAIVAALVGIAAEFSDPATLPLITGVFGPQWTKGLVSVCVLVVLVSKAVERTRKAEGAEGRAVSKTDYTKVGRPTDDELRILRAGNYHVNPSNDGSRGEHCSWDELNPREQGRALEQLRQVGIPGPLAESIQRNETALPLNPTNEELARLQYGTFRVDPSPNRVGDVVHWYQLTEAEKAKALHEYRLQHADPMVLQVEHWFTYHTPDPAQVVAMSELRLKAKELAHLMVQHCPASPDRSVAIRHLRDAVMNANASIVLGGK